ncbi:BTB/POZ domain-containing protein 17-like [Lepisosteus oculatus]|uniref:BTB/POZ domain-containing protein 17-like n=1 Tax=Lepisosteus oculatus TaxID=7918 RepID=UPI0037136767
MKKHRKAVEPVEERPELEMDTKMPSETLDNHQEIMEELCQLFNSEDFCDVQLVINEKVFLKAHRVILAIGSDFFRNMFSNDSWQESKQNVIQLKEQDNCVDYFQDFLRYFYTGCITVNAENLFPIYMLSDKYGVLAVKQGCEKFALKNVTNGPISQAIAWCQQAAYMNFKELEEACNKFIALNMMAVAKSPEWLSLEPEYLDSLLSRPDLVVESEFELFRAVKRWLSQNKGHADEILKHVRFPLMAPEDVYDPGFLDTLPEKVKETFSSQSVLVYQVNSLPIETISLFHDVLSPPFSMRLYTSPNFGCSRKMNNFSCSSSVSIEFSTRLFQLRTSWSITTQGSCQDRYRGNPCTSSACPSWTCRVKECNLSGENHDHKLCLLLYKNIDEKWLVCHYKTYDIPHGQDVGLGNLVSKSEREQCMYKNTIFAHFIGKTLWKRP